MVPAGDVMGKTRPKKPVWRTLAVAVLGVALSAASQGAVGAAESHRAFRSDDCFRNPADIRDLDTYSTSVPADAAALNEAAQCEARLARGSRPYLQVSYALYHAAKANRIIAEGGAPDAAQRLQEAARQFSAAMTTNPQLVNAPLELARVQRLRGNFDAANAQLDQLARSGAIGGPALSYEQAMVILDRLGPVQQPESDDAAASRRDDLLRAATYLRVFSSNMGAASPYVAARGPRALAYVSNELGERSMAMGLTRDNALEARNRFGDAKLATDLLLMQPGVTPDDSALAARVYFNLGRSQLRYAGFDRIAHPTDSADLECATALQNAYAIPEEIERNFQTALRFGSPQARWGIGCVRMARGQYAGDDGAVRWFQDAVASGTPQPVLRRSEYALALARALTLAGQENIALQRYDEALRAETSDASRRGDRTREVRIYIERANIFLHRQMTDEALRSLAGAVGASPDDLDPAGDITPNAEAYFSRGKILFERNNPATRGYQGDAYFARLNFTRAASMDSPRQAESYYYLSQLEERAGNGQAAYRAADAAFHNVTGDDDLRDAYRRQACLVRIRFNLTDRQGLAYCTAEEGRPNYPEALLYEGMFWLRESHNHAGGSRQDDWSNALRSFERGLDRINSTGWNGDVDGLSVRDLLDFGRRTVRLCAGLGAADTQTTPPGVRDYYAVKNHIPPCQRG